MRGVKSSHAAFFDLKTTEKTEEIGGNKEMNAKRDKNGLKLNFDAEKVTKQVCVQMVEDELKKQVGWMSKNLGENLRKILGSLTALHNYIDDNDGKLEALHVLMFLDDIDDILGELIDKHVDILVIMAKNPGIVGEKRSRAAREYLEENYDYKFISPRMKLELQARESTIKFIEHVEELDEKGYLE